MTTAERCTRRSTAPALRWVRGLLWTRSSGLADATSHDVRARANRPLTTDELVELARHPLVTIGVHTVSHRRLTELSPSAAAAEIGDARDHLDHLLGRHARPLAYPFGNANRDVAAIARGLGFDHAVTTKPRFVRVGDDPLLLPRLEPRDVDRDDFAAWLDWTTLTSGCAHGSISTSHGSPSFMSRWGRPPSAPSTEKDSTRSRVSKSS